MDLPYAEPFKIKSVEMLKRTTREERVEKIKEAKYNLFNLNSDDVYIDLLTDSGTGAMSDKQWAEMMIGDESYAGARSFRKLKSTITEITGYEHVLPTHQGRAAENVLFSALVKEGDVVPGNSHFDTTKGHIEFRKAKAIDCTIDEAFETTLEHPFKGNIDLEKLEKVFKENPKEKIPMCIVTITCNTSGGQPVSLANIKAVSKLCKEYGIKVIFDSARFAENAYFIKTREEEYKDWSIREICKEVFSYGDGMTMSSKKDAIVNMGGFIALREKELYDAASVFGIVFEGYLTYGGMSGRDMGALAQGLIEGTDFDFLESRILQVKQLGDKLTEYGIPIQKPAGGHAIFVDAKKFLPHIDEKEMIAQTLAVELYIEGGVRGVEIGTLLADRDPETRKNRHPKLELLRLAIPRRVYTSNHIDFIAAALKNVWDRKETIKRGFKITREAPIMRHFTIELDRYKDGEEAID
ncbi:MAG: tyrosine phenol-lyase [Candidatus Cloacimonadota bacterium]|nr:MAG: tyrosine phenol-lyase [Candidatus Cloacimonadota bacterium]PIE77504.1 MAG: tyrosine phenol-lyase [Candidatus Delongbacteria bacterium]